VESSERVLVGTVGYHILRNHSVGPVLLPKLKQQDWPAGVSVEELNWGPIAIVQQRQALPEPYERVVLLVAIERAGRAIGNIDLFRWEGHLPDETQIQACVGDAATGVISVDNLLVIGEYFKIWPREVLLVDVEPGPETAGENLTPEVEAKVPVILQLVRRLAIEGAGEQDAIHPLRGDTLFETGTYNYGESRH